jgi:hypothetical protein
MNHVSGDFRDLVEGNLPRRAVMPAFDQLR